MCASMNMHPPAILHIAHFDNSHFIHHYYMLFRSLDYLGLGINCTNPEYVSDLLDIMAAVVGSKSKSSHPIVVYPNKGEILAV